MQKQTEEKLLEVLIEMRNWLRVSVRGPVKAALEAALPDQKSRMAYQMLDGTASIEQVRIACKLSPNAVVALSAKCVSLGLMETNGDKKRIRLFDLREHDLLEATEAPKNGSI